MLDLLSGKNILTLLIQKKMRVEQELLKFFHIFHHNCQKKKDNNKADAILIASFFYETYQKEE